MDASIFDSALSHTRRSDASEKKKIARPLLDVFDCGQVSSPRLYRLSYSYFNHHILKTIPWLGKKILNTDFEFFIHSENSLDFKRKKYFTVFRISNAKIHYLCIIKNTLFIHYYIESSVGWVWLIALCCRSWDFSLVFLKTRNRNGE